MIKSKLRRVSAISMFALASFTMTSIVQPTNANAIIGIFCWPLLIVGGVLEVAAIATLPVTSGDPSPSFILMFTGLVFLDENGSNKGEFSKLNADQAIEFGLTHDEHHAYNSKRHQMKHVFETVWTKVQENGGTTTADARSAFLEVSQSLDHETQVAFQALEKILTIRYSAAMH